MTKKKKILLISTDWSANSYRKDNNAPGAISQYRLIYPMRMLEKWFDIDYIGSDFKEKIGPGDEAEGFRKLFSQYDLVVSKITDNDQAASAIRFITKYLGIPLIVDIDDNIWELKKDQPGSKQYFKGSKLLAIASTYVSMADAVFCSTQPLADYVKDRILKAHGEEKEVFVLPNCIDPNDYKHEKAKLNPNKIVIGWQGSTTHHEDLKLAMPALSKLLMEYPNLEVELLGGVPKEQVFELFQYVDESALGRVRTLAGCPAFDEFPKLLASMLWDIAIAPITDEVFNHCKSHIKWMEYAMYNIPCVASKVYPYYMRINGTRTIEDGVTGLLATPEQWYEKLKELVDDEKKREQIAKTAGMIVREEWNIHECAYDWRNAIDTLLEKEEEGDDKTANLS